MSTLRVVLLAVGLINACAAFALAYEAPDFQIAGAVRFFLALLAAASGFLLIQLRGWADAGKRPETPVTETPPGARVP